MSQVKECIKQFKQDHKALSQQHTIRNDIKYLNKTMVRFQFFKQPLATSEKYKEDETPVQHPLRGKMLRGVWETKDELACLIHT